MPINVPHTFRFMVMETVSIGGVTFPNARLAWIKKTISVKEGIHLIKYEYFHDSSHYKVEYALSCTATKYEPSLIPPHQIFLSISTILQLYQA